MVEDGVLQESLHRWALLGSLFLVHPAGSSRPLGQVPGPLWHCCKLGCPVVSMVGKGFGRMGGKAVSVPG